MRHHLVRGQSGREGGGKTPLQLFPPRSLVNAIQHHLQQRNGLHTPRPDGPAATLFASPIPVECSSDERNGGACRSDGSVRTGHAAVDADSLAEGCSPYVTGTMPPTSFEDGVCNKGHTRPQRPSYAHEGDRCQGRVEGNCENATGTRVVRFCDGKHPSTTVTSIRRSYQVVPSLIVRNPVETVVVNNSPSNRYLTSTLVSAGSSRESVVLKTPPPQDGTRAWRSPVNHASVSRGVCSEAVRQSLPDLTRERGRSGTEKTPEARGSKPPSTVVTPSGLPSSLHITTTTVTQTVKKVKYLPLDEPFVDSENDAEPLSTGHTNTTPRSNPVKVSNAFEGEHRALPVPVARTPSPGGRHPTGAGPRAPPSWEVHRSPLIAVRGARGEATAPVSGGFPLKHGGPCTPRGGPGEGNWGDSVKSRAMVSTPTSLREPREQCTCRCGHWGANVTQTNKLSDGGERAKLKEPPLKTKTASGARQMRVTILGDDWTSGSAYDDDDDNDTDEGRGEEQGETGENSEERELEGVQVRSIDGAAGDALLS